MRLELFPVAALCVFACGTPLPEPEPIPAPAELAAQLRELGRGPLTPQLIEFRWRYRGHEGRFSGDGGVRVNPPDSVRLDLLEPGGGGVQSAVLVGQEVVYIGERRLQLPPPTFIWAIFGIFRPPHGIVPEGTRRGDQARLSYRLTARETVAFDFDRAGYLIRAERLRDGDSVQRIEIEHRDDEPETSGRYVLPKNARFRDLVEFIEVRIEVVKASEHEPFESTIFDVA